MTKTQEFALELEINVFDLIIRLFKDSIKESFTSEEVVAAVEVLKEYHIVKVSK